MLPDCPMGAGGLPPPQVNILQLMLTSASLTANLRATFISTAKYHSVEMNMALKFVHPFLFTVTHSLVNI